MIVGSDFPTFVYIDHQALESIMKVGTNAHDRISRWMNRLTEYDYVVRHRPCKANIMQIADDMSRMPERYSQFVIVEDSERMIMTLIRTSASVQEEKSRVHVNLLAEYRDSIWYGGTVAFLQDGLAGISERSRSEIRAIKRMVYRYRLADKHLLYVEYGGETVKCLLSYLVKRILQ